MNRMLRGWMAAVGLAALLAAPSAATANMLVNPSFEDFIIDGGPRPTGWIWFDNTYSEAMAFAHSGERVEKFFGNWAYPWNAAGVIQKFPAASGQLWQLDCFAYHWSGDPLVVDPNPALNNRLIMKIEFQDAGGAVVGFNEAVIVDPYTPKDVWIDVPPVQATAPANTAWALGVFVFLQPNFQGGSAWIDDAWFVPEPSSLMLLALGGLLAARRR